MAGIAEPLLARGNIGHHAAFGADDRALAERDVIRDADLAPQHHVIAEHDAAGEPAFGADDAMPADRAVVADLHEIIDLGPLADHGVAAAAAVDRGVGADLDIVLDDDAAKLRNLDVTRGARMVAESVLTDPAAAVQR